MGSEKTAKWMAGISGPTVNASVARQWHDLAPNQAHLSVRSRGCPTWIASRVCCIDYTIHGVVITGPLVL